MGDRYQIMMFIADDTFEELGAGALRGFLGFEIRARVASLGYTPVGEVATLWTQLSAQDAELLGAGHDEPVFTLAGPPRTAAAGDWCARAWVAVAEDVPVAEKLGEPPL